MSHRYYFHILKKEKLEEIRNMSKNEFFKWGESKNLIYKFSENDIDLPLYKLGKRYFELGSNFENTPYIEKNGIPLFKDKELLEIYKENTPFIVGEEIIINEINHLKGKIIKMYERLIDFSEIKDKDKEDIEVSYEEIRSHLRIMLYDWKDPIFNGSIAINTDIFEPSISNSSKFEYIIFELIRLYKTTDWNKYQLLFIGW